MRCWWEIWREDFADDPHLDSDTTFAVRSAIVQLQKHEAPDELKAQNQSKPFYTTEFDFVLKPVTLCSGES
ncbi:hypothetical protein [Nostoc sphaeroides]|uniref:Uncharacterized protein n=1 Tax=Nostoc sphaeroides CCNUC1 TaxID=2653204 RepID=A0A5P8WEN2_9NOSO|nr:hypothetical protein [Nostoc sphaeroides]QFS50992.1 hypothetical protein GXM_08486 [Nostoc sphaeroides CCNUC1]